MNSRRNRFAALVLTGVIVLAGCGGDDDDDASPATSEETTTSTAPDTGDVTAGVTAAYTGFFENFNGDLALLEDGDTFTAADIEGLRAVAAGGTITITVHTVTALPDEQCAAAVLTPPCAEVSYDLVLNGQPVLPGAVGNAVFQDGTWKVAKGTFCALAGLGGASPAACV